MGKIYPWGFNVRLPSIAEYSNHFSGVNGADPQDPQNSVLLTDYLKHLTSFTGLYAPKEQESAQHHSQNRIIRLKPSAQRPIIELQSEIHLVDQSPTMLKQMYEDQIYVRINNHFDTGDDLIGTLIRKNKKTYLQGISWRTVHEENGLVVRLS